MSSKFKVGDKVYSPYFNSYLIITRIKSNGRWWFVIEDRPGNRELEARTSLDEMTIS